MAPKQPSAGSRTRFLAAEVLEGSALGALVELLVEAEILAGSDGRLIASKMEPDVDHRDLFVTDAGGFGALWIQVKGTSHTDREGRVVAFANYPADTVPESNALIYVVGLVDLEQHALGRVWVVPSADFNRLAYREHDERKGRITLQFSCVASGDPRWDEFEVPRPKLLRRLEPMVRDAGPATAGELATLRDASAAYWS